MGYHVGQTIMHLHIRIAYFALGYSGQYRFC